MVAACCLLQAAVMRQLFACCSARQVKWLLRVIVKDLKVRHADVLKQLNIAARLQGKQ
jgi:hypothetical protein